MDLPLESQILFMSCKFLSVFEWSAGLKMKLFELWAPIGDTSFRIQCSVDMTHAKETLATFTIPVSLIKKNRKGWLLFRSSPIYFSLIDFSVKDWNSCCISFLWDLCRMDFPSEWRTCLWLPLLLWHIKAEESLRARTGANVTYETVRWWQVKTIPHRHTTEHYYPVWKEVSCMCPGEVKVVSIFDGETLNHCIMFLRVHGGEVSVLIHVCTHS